MSKTLTPEQVEKIRRHVLERAVPGTKEILESGGLVPDDMADEDAWAAVDAVLAGVRAELAAVVTPRPGTLVQFQCEKEGTLFYYQHESVQRARTIVARCPVCGSTRVKVLRAFPAIDET